MKPSPTLPPKPDPKPGDLVTDLVTALADGKAEDIVTLDIAADSDFADTMIIATGRSPRHLRALADDLVFRLKKLGHEPSLEGGTAADWLLIDIGDVLVHLFQAESRNLYNLEKLWGGAVRPA